MCNCTVEKVILAYHEDFALCMDWEPEDLRNMQLRSYACVSVVRILLFCPQSVALKNVGLGQSSLQEF